MRIISCHIENFGKLQDINFEFGAGCNLICEQNGWGKSTLAAFIRVMFFGFRNDGKRDPYENERKRFMPWQKGIYGGELKFEQGGVPYLVRRVFGAKASEDEFELTRADTNLISRDFSVNLGEELFQIDAASFDRTVYFTQNDCKTEVTDRINAKIGNLAENTDDINNYDSAWKQLSDLLNGMSPSRKTGSLSKLKSRMTELEIHVRGNKEIETTMQAVSERRNIARQERDGLSLRQKQLQEMQNELSACKDLEIRRNKYLDLQEELRKRERQMKEAALVFNGVIPEEENLAQMLEIYNESESEKKTLAIYELSEQEIKKIQYWQDKLERGFPTDGEFERALSEAKECDRMCVENQKEQLSIEETTRLQRLSQKYGENGPTGEELNEIGRRYRSYTENWHLLQAKQLSLRTLESVARQNASRQNRKRKTNFMLRSGIAGVILMLAGILGLVSEAFVGGLMMTVFGAGVLLAAILIGFLNKAGDRGDVEPEDETIKALRKEVMQDEKDNAEALEMVQDFCNKYHLFFEENGFADEIRRMQTELQDYRQLTERNSAALHGEKNQQRRALQQRLQQFMEQFGNMEEEQLSYASSIAMLWEQARTYRSFLQKQDTYKKISEAYRQKITKMEEYLRGIRLLPGDDLGKQFSTLLFAVRDYRTVKKEYERAAREVDQFLKAENVERLLSMKQPECELSLEEITDQLKRIADRIEELFRTIESYTRQLEQLQESYEEIQGLEEELEQSREQYTRDIQTYRMLDKTRELLEEARSSFTGKYTEPVMHSFLKYYDLLSGKEREAFTLDANTQMHVIENNLARDIVFLSNGKRDLTGICMRMALVETMYQEEPPFLVMDDPFVNLDEETTEGAFRFLNEVAKKYQIIYFTCHESRCRKIGKERM